MAHPILFTITEIGKQTALNAATDAAALKINLIEVGLGAGKYTPTGNETKLASELQRRSIVSGDVELASHTLRFSSSMTAATVTNVYELGLFTDDDVLFAVAASSNLPLFTLHPDITFVASFGLSVADIAKDSVTVTTDSNGALSIALMQQHLASFDPHPQYFNQQRFLQFLELAYPYGYPYWTHSKSNPKPLFDAMFGYETYWRRLEGVGLVAVKDSDAYIDQPMLTLGQRGTTELATTERPHTYPIYTSYLFERYDPSTVVETVWKVAANKTSINEGDAVRFTVTANNLPDGQILNWSAKEGALNNSSNDISSPEKIDNGTVILKNGQAIINLTTTPDDNSEEPQKHVRLVVGAPANLSINVPINDAGHHETVMHISQSTTNGIDLAEYYKLQSGSYPSSDDIVRFIVDEGVDIIAPNTATPALIEGANWPVTATPIVENHGRILGRGGDGGIGAVLIRAARYESKLAYSDTAKKGGDGGTAIQSTTRPILIENYNLIAGGGGGGGGGGAYVYDFSSSDQRVGHQNGTAAGGGAPLGKASINAGSFEWYMADDRNDNRALVTANMDVNNPFPAFAGLTFSGTTIANAVMNLDSLYFNGRIVIDEPANLRGDFKDMPLWIPSMRKAVENSSLYNKYKLQIENDPDDRVFFQKVWPDSDSEIYNLSTVCKKATDASVSSAGLGGYSVGAYNDTRGVYQGDDGGDLSINSGGHGGALGENGQTFVLSKYLLLDNVNDTNSIAPKAIDKSQLSSSRAHELAPASGGLAGYVKEGSVTITNYLGGTTKGR